MVLPQSVNRAPKLPLAPYTGSLMDARQQFAALSTCLLRDVGEPIEFREAAYDLYALFNEIGGKPQDVIGAEAFTWQQETLLPTGKAINPNAAATCLLDYARTRAFARGVHDAIEAAKIRFPGECIEILYAGTGPYAPLALMQTPFFGPDEVRFTLIDMHESALSCQAQIISVLGLEEYIEEAVQADAAQWIPPDEKQYHVAIAEVMQRALIVEPQVAVTLALSKHMRPGGLLVPERIELTLCLLDPGAEQTLADACADRFSEYFRLSGDSIPDAGEFRPEFVIQQNEIVGNTIEPSRKRPRKGIGQVWRAKLRVISTDQETECWVLRRIGSGIASQLELVSDKNLRAHLGLPEDTSVSVTMIEGSERT